MTASGWLDTLDETAREAEQAATRASVDMHDIGNRASMAAGAFRAACTPDRIRLLVAVARAAMDLDDILTDEGDSAGDYIVRLTEFRDALAGLAAHGAAETGVEP